MPHSSIAEQSKSLAPPLSLQQTFGRLLLFLLISSPSLYLTSIKGMFLVISYITLICESFKHKKFA